MHVRPGRIGLVLVAATCAVALAQPTVTGFSPSSGSPGTAVTVSGLSFDPTPGATDVAFGGVSAGPLAVEVHASGASLTVVVPGGAATGPIAVTTGAGTATTAGLPRPTFTVSDAPALVGFFPDSGVAGQRVRLYGRGLLTVSAVTFTGGATVAPPFDVHVDSSGTVVDAVVPSGAASGPIVVDTSGGSASTASLEPSPPDGSGDFLVDLPPEVEAFHPPSGPAGTVVIVSGRNLFGTQAVTLDGDAIPIERVDDSGTALEVRVPPGAMSGVLAVATPLGTASTAGLDTPAFAVDAVPRIDGVYPPTADLGAGVTISGANFGAPAIPPFLPSENVVTFGGVEWLVERVSPQRTWLTARVVLGSAGTTPVEVTTPGGSAVSPEDFTVTAVPIVTGFQPGSAVPGARIAVIGRNLGRATSVTFNGVATMLIASDAAGTSLEATVPAGATSGPIAVTTPGGTTSTAYLVPPRLFVVTPGSPCGNGTVDPSEACDDGNLTAGDCCDALCRLEPAGTTCDDGVFCNGSDTCDATGACSTHAGDPCAGGPECGDACDEATGTCLAAIDTPCTDDGDLCSDDVCDGDGACTHPVRPWRACKAPVRPGASRLELVRKARPEKSRLLWRFARGDATTVAELGDPTTTTRYAFCLFDGAGELAWRAGVPPGGTCGGKPCWRLKKSAVIHQDPTLATAGIRRVDVTAARAGRTRASVLAKGTSLVLPALPIAVLPVVAQLHDDVGACWGATYGEALRNEPDAFVSRSDPPATRASRGRAAKGGAPP